MSLLALVTDRLRGENCRFALVGATAMVFHGVSRATHDIDLFTTDTRCLDDAFWRRLAHAGTVVEARRGDDADPLAGVVRCSDAGGEAVDLVVGKHAWQSPILDRAESQPWDDGLSVPVVSRADLVLLKLYAGGLQDQSDILQLLAAGGDGAVTAMVDERVKALPPAARRLWRKLRQAASRPG